jgi:hypothetical protein
MKKLDFSIPFSGFCSTSFINCFASVYMYLEGFDGVDSGATFCNEWVNGQCNSCGNCATKPQALQERFFFLFDTMCGRSSLRCRFDGQQTETEFLINGKGDFYDGGSEDNIDFLFGFAGYNYHTVTNIASFKNEIISSIEDGKPVIVKLRDNKVPFAVVTGYDDDSLICPDFRAAQKSPEPAVAYDGIIGVFVIGDKTTPQYTLADGLKRIERVMEYSLTEGLWDGYMKKIGTYGPDSLGDDKPEGRKLRMKRLAATMWHTFNCHNFAEVFRVYLGERKSEHVYDGIKDVKMLGNHDFGEMLNTISWRYGYTHDLAWSIIGLDECINWDDWKSHYYGDMLEVIILKLKENDEAVLECVKKLITALGENH